jgi:hypothetical protein
MPDMPNQGAPAPEAANTSAEQSQEQENEVEGQEAEGSEEGSDESAVEGKEVADLSKKEQKDLAKELKKKFKLKVDGKEVEEEVDFNDEEGMIKRLQLGKAAQKRMQEATELRKAAEEFIDMLRKNPRKVLSDPNIGVDLKQFAQEIINEEIENAAKSPEQVEKEKLQKELEELKGKFEKDEKERKEREFSRLQAEQEEKIQGDIETALSSNELPKTPYTVRKMAEMMMLALQNDIDLSPKDLVPLLRKQMSSDIKELFSSSSDEVLEEMLGKDTISRLRKRTVAKVKQQQVAQTANSVKSAAKTEEKSEKKSEKINMRDFLRNGKL